MKIVQKVKTSNQITASVDRERVKRSKGRQICTGEMKRSYGRKLMAKDVLIS
jgi:hypothetical protein